MTFSIVAACDGVCGVAVSSRVPAVGALCAHARSGAGAVATQAFVNPLLGIDGVVLLTEYPAAAVLDRLLAADPAPQRRQLAVVDARGGAVAHTGELCEAWSGHRIGDGVAVAGNALADAATLQAMTAAFERHPRSPLDQRLLTALEAGHAAGGDRRGHRSTALLVVTGQDYPYVDLRVDDHPDPVGELRRVHDVARRELLPLLATLPTRGERR